MDLTAPSLPSYRDYLVVQPPKLTRPIFIDSSDEEDTPRKRRKGNNGYTVFSHGSEGPHIGDLRDMSPLPEGISFEDVPKMCVLRASPLKCINQDIVGLTWNSLIDRRNQAYI